MEDFRVFYDEKEDILYLARKGQEEEVVEFAPGVNVELDASGSLIPLCQCSWDTSAHASVFQKGAVALGSRSTPYSLILGGFHTKQRRARNSA